MIAVFSAVNPRFFSLAAAANILQDFSPVMLMAIGQTFVIATGGIDLSGTGEHIKGGQLHRVDLAGRHLLRRLGRLVLARFQRVPDADFSLSGGGDLFGRGSRKGRFGNRQIGPVQQLDLCAGERYARDGLIGRKSRRRESCEHRRPRMEPLATARRRTRPRGRTQVEFEREYLRTETIELSGLSTVPPAGGKLPVDSGRMPRVAAPPSPPMPTSGRSPHRPLPLFEPPTCYCETARENSKGPEPLRCLQSDPGPVTAACSTRAAAGTKPVPATRDPANRCHSEDSARAPHRAIARQGARAHAKTRRERRRHVVERRAAVAAHLLWRVLDAEPVAARGTLGSQTLHRPSGQILHPFTSQSA